MKDNEKNVKLKIAGCVDAITSCTREYNDENAFWETYYWSLLATYGVGL